MFQVFQMFQRYVSSVSYGYCKSRLGCCTCCNGYIRMSQEFVQNVLSVSDVCCKYFIWMLHTQACCKRMFQVFHTYVAYVSSICWLCTCFQASVLGVCCKCFRCFGRMFQVFSSGYCKSRYGVTHVVMWPNCRGRWLGHVAFPRADVWARGGQAKQGERDGRAGSSVGSTRWGMQK
jgi:hypothetical protein